MTVWKQSDEFPTLTMIALASRLPVDVVSATACLRDDAQIIHGTVGDRIDLSYHTNASDVRPLRLYGTRTDGFLDLTLNGRSDGSMWVRGLGRDELVIGDSRQRYALFCTDASGKQPERVTYELRDVRYKHVLEIHASFLEYAGLWSVEARPLTDAPWRFGGFMHAHSNSDRT